MFINSPTLSISLILLLSKLHSESRPRPKFKEWGPKPQLQTGDLYLVVNASHVERDIFNEDELLTF